MQPLLIVTKRDKRFECIKEGACGMAIGGDGLSVLEAIGSWCLYSGIIQAKCDPPELLDKFTAKKVVGHLPAPRRA